MKFGELILSKREQRKLSVRQVAVQVGTTASYLYELEQGKTVNIRLPLAAKLSQVLKVPMATLAAAALAEEERNARAAKRRKRK
ncbi:MAG: helix-turn-helix transcriptional regulator [Proteobacteria bacterium]|nr:helix-turn-helix transcriptional regulator [Pseudomonadota bacterium]